MTPIYGHKSEETAYVVEDYPYGYKLRCTIRYWLEFKPSKGYRFVSQTKNPKNNRWNAPKASTYMSVSGCMFLDENGHVKWSGVSHYSSLADLKRFAESFPEADLTAVKGMIEAEERRAIADKANRA